MLRNAVSNPVHVAGRPTDAPSNDLLEDRIEALELACSGLWHLLKAKHGYTDEELAQAVYAVDAMDGQIDGRKKPVQVVCPTCGRPSLTRNRTRCLWCGQPFISSPL
jgi:hypothetical protein